METKDAQSTRNGPLDQWQINLIPLPIPDVAPSLCRRPHSQDVHIPTVDPESAGGQGVSELLIGLGSLDDCDQAEVCRVV